MKFAILGGGGCFGLNLARHLLQSGHEVVGCGRSALRGEAFTLGADRLGYRYRVFSIGPDNEFIADWLEAERPAVIVNFAAQGEGAASYRARHWKYFYATNVEALVELTELLVDRPWLRRFVHVGTSEVYGSVEAPATERTEPRPSSPYAVSKLAFDQHLVSIHQHWGFPALICRPSNCLCAGQQLHRVVPKTFVLALTGRRLPLHGGGQARKSYLDAEDLSRALALLAERGTPGEVYNAGPLEDVAIRQIVELAASVLGRPLEQIAESTADRTGQDARYWLDSSKLRSLGWAPQVALDEAVARVGRWVAGHLDVLRYLPTEYEMRA